MTQYDTKLAEFKQLISKIEYLKYTLNGLVYWDKITCMPKEGLEYRSRVMSFLADEQYKLLSDETFRKYMDYFDENPNNNQVTKSMIRRIKRSSSYISKVPEDEYADYIGLIAVSEQVWAEAKESKDFEKFSPYLGKIMETFRKFTEYWGYEEEPYDALLGYYEEGLTVSSMDTAVNELRTFLISYIEKVREKAEEKPSERVLSVDRMRQENIWKKVLTDIGFSFDRGRIDTGSHATILANSPFDVRIVNTFCETELRTGIFNVLHSGGKGIYQQSVDPRLLGTFLAEAPSFTMEECIGRFYENILGRSKGFCKYFHGAFEKAVPELHLSGEQLYRASNTINLSPIRLTADELTFLVHIIIRYELERDLINGQIKVKDLPLLWNEKYRNYLGVVPADDGQGVLQDIHWAAGYVGYFPTYVLSNIWAAQLAGAIEREKGDLDKLIEEGNFEVINSWLKEHIFRHGAVYSSEELLKRATGERINSKYYIDYLRKKYSEVYKLNSF